MALKNISSAARALLALSLFLAIFAGGLHAVNGCASTGTPNCANIGKECCTTQGDPSYDKCVAADDLCVTSCGAEIPGSGSCNPQGTPSSFDECTAIEHASCCGKADGCTWDNSGCHMAAGHYVATIMCSELNNQPDGCGIFEAIQACSWSQPSCAQSSQLCGASSPINLQCCPGAGSCIQSSGAWRCSCPGVGGDCSSNACCSGLTCQPSSKLCCYASGGSCTQGGSQCCPGSACNAAGACEKCPGKACASASDCCTGYACEPKPKGSPTKLCCIADNSATSCAYGSDCCSGICTGHVCQPAMCDVVPTISSYTDITLDPKFGEIDTYTYNLSEKDYVKTGLPNAFLFLVNLTDQSNIRICYTVTDSTGHMQMTYDPTAPGCTDYWFIFCPDGKAIQNDADGLKARETCLNSTKIDHATLIYPVPTACEGSPPAPKSYLDHILSHNELYFCNKVTKDYAPLCWPLMLILGLLLGASFAAGKNPFHAFDFSSPRMNRGRQYSMRVQNKSFDFLSYLMGAATTAMSAKSMAKALSKGGGGFGNMLKNEARAAFNPGAAIDGLKGGMSGQAALNKELRQANKELADANKSGDKGRIDAAQKRVGNAQKAIAIFKETRSAMNEYKKADREARRSEGDAKAKAIQRREIAKGKLQSLYLQYVALKSDLAPSTPRVATFDEGGESGGKPSSATSVVGTSTQSNKVGMAVSPSSQKLNIGMLERVGMGGPLTRRELREQRKTLLTQRKQNVVDSKLAKKEIKKDLKNAPPEEKARLREQLGAVKQELNVARIERSQARGWRLGAEAPKSVKQQMDEAKKKIEAAKNSGDAAAEKAARAELSSLEKVGQTRAQFRIERKNESAIAKTNVVAKTDALNALVKSGASTAEIAKAKHELAEAKALRFRMNNWVYGDAKPELDKQVAVTDAKNIAEFGREMKRNGVALSDSDLARIMGGEKVALTAEKTGKNFTVETKDGKIVATELWQSTSEWKQIRSAAVEKARSGTGEPAQGGAFEARPGKAIPQERQERRQAISDARDIGRMPSTGISGATASAYGARDTIGTIASLFRKDTWNMSSRQDRMAASGVDEYFKYAANANSTGQAFAMLLGFVLKKMMENAKLRNSEKQQGVRVQVSMSFRGVNESIKTLFRVYSVMSVLSAYTKGLGAATGSSALKGGIGFMETINSAGFGSIGKYNINAATLASWVDTGLSQQMVGGGLPFPFSKLQGAVGGTVAGGAVLVQKFSDLLGRDIRVSYTDGEKTFVLATEETGSKKGTLMMDSQGNFLVGRCVGKEGQLIEGYAGKPLQISDMKRTYVVVKDGNYMQMNEREATRYDRTQADRAGTLANANAYALQVDGFFTKKSTTAEVDKYLRDKEKPDKEKPDKAIEGLSNSAKKIVVRSSEQKALNLLASLPDMSSMNGEEQMKIIRLRSTLETHAAFTDDLLGLIRGTAASKMVLSLIQSHKTRESLFAELDSNKSKLEALEAKEAKAQAEHRELSEKDNADKFTYEENVKQLTAAVGFFDAIKASGLDVNADVIKNIDVANGKIISNMMRALDFQDSYARCYSAAIVMGFEDRMPDITIFQQKGADALRNHDYPTTLDQMADQMSTQASVRFKDRQSLDSYRKSLARVMDAGQEYLATQSVEDKQAYAEALTGNARTLLDSVKFDGRFAEVKYEIAQNLEQASKQRNEYLDRYIEYVDRLVQATVALHQTSDSYISAQMAKSGWQDRAPYQSSPETEALLSTAQGTDNYVEGKRPSMETGHSSPMWFGSRSSGLYLEDAIFKVPPVPTEQPIQPANVAAPLIKKNPALAAAPLIKKKR